MFLLWPCGCKLLLEFLPHALIHLLKLFQGVCTGRDNTDVTGLSPEEHALLSMCPRHWVRMVKSRAQWLQRNTLVVMGQTHEGSLTSPQHHRCVLPHQLHVTLQRNGPNSLKLGPL